MYLCAACGSQREQELLLEQREAASLVMAFVCASLKSYAPESDDYDVEAQRLCVCLLQVCT